MAKFRGANIVCIQCGKEFKVSPNRAKIAKYCSPKCKYQYWVGKHLKGGTIERNCKFCDKKFKTFKSHDNNFCSRQCFWDSKKKREFRFCKECRKKFEVKKSSSSVFCSWDCRVIWLAQPRKYTHNLKLQEWTKTRARVLVRDDFKCQQCGFSGYRMSVHHKISSNDGGDNSLDNLITLCAPCHARIHNEERFKT